MLNYILPPIVIVLSVSALIMFLFRKAKQIPAADFIAEQEKIQVEKKTTKIVISVGQFSLKFLEKMMHRSKLLSLKFHNLSNSWFQAIREKRQQVSRVQQENVENRMLARENIESSLSSQVNNDSVETKRVTRPMIAKKATLPQPVAAIKEKNKLEEALIRRIAINPKDIEAYERLGDYYLESENFQDSLECFKQVLRLSPVHHKARLRIRRLERMKIMR